jgi:transcriptional regulator with XRE-family HTH domain
MTTRWKRFCENQMEDAKQRELIESELENLQLGVQIAKLRAAENLSQTKLAARAEMNAPKISAMENGPCNLTMGTLIRVAHALGSRVENQAGPQERDETGTAEQAEKEKSKPAALKPKAAAPGPIGKFRVESLKFK